ncbi:phosphoketolase [Ilumatobacter sp.]|uniref:phosphoketolase family protein n=1 Tax=Ilumatobacter sp. TaxID=1967498 RepID=UPI003B524DF5
MTHLEAPDGPRDRLDLDRLDRHWRAANYVSVGQIYLVDNPLLEVPLAPEHVKRRLLGHWGTTPGLNFVLTHLQRVVVELDVDLFPVIGPGHGGPAMLAATWLDGSYSELHPHVSRDREGLGRLFRQFSFPRGVPSHVSPQTPGSMHEGGELGYSLVHAVGAAFDSPELVVACVVGDGEAETGALAASWQSTAFLDPVRDGAVLPILHANGWKIANPTVLGRRSDSELRGYLRSMGWEPSFVEVGGTHDPEADEAPWAAHRAMASALDEAMSRIRRIQRDARDRGADDVERWPMIVLRSPKGWTGPAVVDGDRVEGTWRAHQVPVDDVRDDADHLDIVETWMRSYRPHELFDEAGRPRPAVVDWLPVGDRRFGANPHPHGGRLLRDLVLPDPSRHGPPVSEPGATSTGPTARLGEYLRDVLDLNATAANFRLFGPDETASNRLDAVYEVTGTTWQLDSEPADDEELAIDRRGRVLEVLSEHLCQGWLEGYLLTGRHGLFSCYEAFVHIVDSMFNQHAKWLEAHTELDWRPPIASLNYLLTSHVWQQDHNGFSHQDPGFLDVVSNKSSRITRIYLPPDTNSLLQVADHCLRTRDRINVIVAGKQPTPDWLTPDEAADHLERGASTWGFASDEREPDVVLGCAGDVPTVEALAATRILREQLPELAVRVVNVVDLMALQPDDRHPHGMSDDAFDRLFTGDRPVIFAFHGYPWLVHRLVYRRTNHSGFHVHGYQERGSTTTPFDMLVRNDLDRFRLVTDVVDRVPGLAATAPAKALRDEMEDRRRAHVEQITTHGTDLTEIRDWTWVR